MKFVTTSVFFGVVLMSFTITGTSRTKRNKGSQCLKQHEVEAYNLNLVTTFYQEAFGQHDLTAVDRYISCDYIQHNQLVPDGPQGVKDFLVAFNANKKKGPVNIRRVAADGDLVWLHVKTTGFNKEPWAIVDIFRVKGDKIVEHWDVIEVIPPGNEGLNSNSML